jgi:hypothetical protein
MCPKSTEDVAERFVAEFCAAGNLRLFHFRFSERESQVLTNGTNVSSQLASFFFVCTSAYV